MNKHTPGPWKIGKPLISNVKHNRGIYCNHGTPDEWMIVEVQGCGQDSECGANARLIAAAPDMLEALKTAQVRIFMLEGESDEYNKITRVLDRAEGASC
jgi:hypothetical protein